MTTFDKREQNFESKFALDAELEFKIRARRNKLLGMWAAELMGYGTDKAKEYAFSIIDEDNKLAGDSDVIAKLVRDMTEAEVDISPDQITEQLLSFEKEAKKQFLGL